MNVREPIFTEVITFKVSPEEKEKIKAFLCKKKKDQLSNKLREFILQAIDNIEKRNSDPSDLEYTTTHEEGITAVYLYLNGELLNNPCGFTSEEAAAEYIKSIGARKRGEQA